MSGLTCDSCGKDMGFEPITKTCAQCDFWDKHRCEICGRPDFNCKCSGEDEHSFNAWVHGKKC